MDKPKVKTWHEPSCIVDYPLGATCKSNHLTSINAGYRTFKPIIDLDKCIFCLKCFLVCPDGVIDQSENKIEIDYDYCKGCGICAHECTLGAITMKKERSL